MLLYSFYPNNSSLQRWLDQRHGSNIRRAIILENIMFKGDASLEADNQDKWLGKQRLGYSSRISPPCKYFATSRAKAQTTHPGRIQIEVVPIDSWDIKRVSQTFLVRCGGPVSRPLGISQDIFISLNLRSAQVLSTQIC